MAAMLHPAQYSAAIVMGGYFSPEFGPFYEPYPPGSPLAARYDLVALARRHPPPVAIWLETSHADPVSYRSSAAFLKVTRPPLSVDAIVLQHAGHRLALWQAILPRTLVWLGANVPASRPCRDAGAGVGHGHRAVAACLGGRRAAGSRWGCSRVRSRGGACRRPGGTGRARGRTKRRIP